MPTCSSRCKFGLTFPGRCRQSPETFQRVPRSSLLIVAGEVVSCRIMGEWLVCSTCDPNIFINDVRHTWITPLHITAAT